MTDSFVGGCRCGAVRYTVNSAAPLKTYACHCTDCQSETGSAFAFQQWVLVGDLDATGQLHAAARVKPDGATVTLFACAACLSRIYSVNDKRPGFAVIRAGTRADSHQLSPDFHIWTRSKQPWLSLPTEAPSWPEGATPAEFAAALQGQF